LLGGALALDLVNTVDPRIGDDLEEFLGSPDDLADWAALAGIARPGERLAVTRRGFARTLSTREALYRVFAAVARRQTPPAADLEQLRRDYARSVAAAALVRRSGAYSLQADARDENAVLLPVLISALELLAAPDRLARVKECAGHGCGWLFVDTSRSGTRRWCRMGSCGSREKMARYRARRHTATRAPRS
jgi:predicted RNA-binding Zn ribbon-like protein